MSRWIWTIVAAWLFLPALVPPTCAQNKVLVTEIKLRTDPENARVRPYESVAVQVLAYGEVTDENNKTQKVRLREGGAKFSLKNKSAGWLSKPFRFQGRESESFYNPQGAGLASIIFGQAQASYLLQDTVLFTAADRPGKYTIEATLNGKSASVTVNVDRNASSRRPREKTNFPGEGRSADPYRSLVEHYAPFVAQETWFQPKSDYLARFDLDGDWRGDNNWATAEEGSSQAYVHYAVMETETHWFLIYNFFHPRDYSDKCVVGTCHENDNEGMILTVIKDGSPRGRLQVMEALAHNNIYSYRADRKVKKNVHGFDGDIELHQGSHPAIFIEAGGHGVFGSDDHHSLFSFRRNEFKSGTGVTYVYKGSAERPRHTNDRNVGYELLPIYDHWWQRAHGPNASREKSFDAFYVYEPYGGRPRPPHGQIAGSFYGRKHGSNKAKPFWGWHDSRTRKKKVLATGQWALDPAYGVSQNLRFPPPFSLKYTFNPYLGIGGAAKSPAPVPSPRPSSRGRVVTRAEPSAAPEFPEAPEAPLAPPSPTPAPIPAKATGFQAQPDSSFDPNSKKGRFDLRLLVDGEIDVLLQGDAIRYHVLNGRPPVEQGSVYTQRIPRATFKKFDLDKKDGRGKVAFLEEPNAGNDYTAKLRISDRKGGDDRYHVRLEWEWDQKAPEPPPPPTWTGSGVFSRHPSSGRTPSLSAPTAPPAPPAAIPSPPPAPVVNENVLAGVELYSSDNNPRKYNRKGSGEFELRGRVHGAVILRIRGDRVFAETLEGIPFKLDRFKFSQPLPSASLKKLDLEKQDGRGDVMLLERPWAQNQFTAVVQVSDPKGGKDDYRFKLKWKK